MCFRIWLLSDATQTHCLKQEVLLQFPSSSALSVTFPTTGGGRRKLKSQRVQTWEEETITVEGKWKGGWTWRQPPSDSAAAPLLESNAPYNPTRQDYVQHKHLPLSAKISSDTFKTTPTPYSSVTWPPESCDTAHSPACTPPLLQQSLLWFPPGRCDHKQVHFLFEDWFPFCFVPSLKKTCARMHARDEILQSFGSHI